jgi:hypothetical protein
LLAPVPRGVVPIQWHFDHRLYQDKKMDPFDILQKYLSDSIIKNGTEQNNYKHLIGSCKKITFSLVENELNKDWVLKLLNAFAMYSTNNVSYRNEANKVIEKGFDKLFEDVEYHNNDYTLIKKVFETYFEKLIENINEKNESILVVTDRVDLEDQLSKTFVSGGELAGKKDKQNAMATSGKRLAEQIGKGTERIMFSLIQKFNSATKLPECVNTSSDFIVLIDEGHRSQGGENHVRMKLALPSSRFVCVRMH